MTEEWKGQLKERWGQYQWENDHAINWKSICIGLGFILLVIGGILCYLK